MASRDLLQGRGLATERGFTLVEIVVAIAILSTVLFALMSTIASGRDSSDSASRTMDVSETLRRVTRRISEELRSGSRFGEDTNENSTLDTGEDTNGNGRLESDWSVTTSSVTFNRYLPGNVFSLPITYRLNGTNLERVVMTDTSGAQTTTVIARSVTAFQVTNTSGRLTILLRVSATTPEGATLERENTTVILPRN